MEFRRCSKGHFYDPTVTSTCPQCAAEGINDVGATEQVVYGGQGMMDYGKTEPVSMDISFEETQPPVGGNGFVTNEFGGGSVVEDYDDATMVTNMDGVPGFTPVVGWLVCIEGPARGTDYRIRPGYNYMGRASHMDICISGDNKIGREKHAMIGYDPEERVFFFGPADGKSIVRLNGKMVMVPEQLKSYDVLTVGSTKLMFVPLCGENFNWE